MEPESTAPGLPLRHLEALLPPDPLNPLVIDLPAILSQQRRDAAIPVSTVPCRTTYDIPHQLVLVTHGLTPVSMRRSRMPQHPARPPLGHVQRRLHVLDRSPPPRRAQ
jgi:hypothetical protein